MEKLLDTGTRVEPGSRLPWRLHRDYPAPVPTLLPDVETSTEPLLPPATEALELSADASRRIVEAIVGNIGLPALCRAYIERVRQIPEVQMVLLHPQGDWGRILTVIDAPPFERQARNRVYEAQHTVLEMIVSHPVEFRLINSQELKDALSEIFPSDHIVLYARR